MTAIRLPQLGESAAEATIVSWLVAVGDTVTADQDLVEVETEKSVMTVTAPASGVVQGPLADEGVKVAVGEQIGVLDTGEESSEDPTTVHQPKKTQPRKIRSTHKQKNLQLAV